MIAIDHSGRLLDAAMKIQQGKSLEIKGARDLPFVNIPLDEIKANVDRVQFQQVCLMVIFKWSLKQPFLCRHATHLRSGA